MRLHFLELTLYTSQIEEQKAFYQDVMGFKLITEDDNMALQAGQTKLTFSESESAPYYHFAFLIPMGRLEASIQWLESRNIELLELEGKKIIDFSDGRAVYWYDTAGNILEFIERSVAPPTSFGPFQLSEIVRINEIGVPIEDPLAFSKQVVNRFGIQPIQPEIMTENFCWVGDHEGAFIVTKIGRPWLPTEKKAVFNPLQAIFSVGRKAHKLNLT